MPRVPAQNVKPRKYCRTEFHPDAEAYLVNLADEMGVNVAYVIRLCVAKSLPEIEETLRSGERPPDEMKKPTKPLKTRVRAPAPIPAQSSQPPPPILTFLETGEMPPAPEESCEPAPSPDPQEDPQDWESPPEPAEQPAFPISSDHLDADPTPTLDPLQLKIQRARQQRRRG